LPDPRAAALDVYQADLSTVVSKCISETEKHLSAIFQAAEDSQATLFFDEPTRCFGKRTEVKETHD
jgi:SpoVK/Ycf46/Vps4 family AAA+-type ATPase